MICSCSLAGTEACLNCPNRRNIAKEYTYIFPSTISYYVPKKTKIKDAYPIVNYYCSECGAEVEKYQEVCYNCGEELDWEDYE